MNDFKTNTEGIRIIKSREALKLRAYLCPAGKWTIGYGHTSDNNFKVLPDSVITKDKAEEIFQNDLRQAEDTVKRQVTVKLNINQFSALVSFVFNVGSLRINGKDSTLLVYLNASCFNEAAQEFNKWIYSNGRKLDGLIERRREEKHLFLTEPV